MEGKYVFGSVAIIVLGAIFFGLIYFGIDGALQNTILTLIGGIIGFLLGLPINTVGTFTKTNDTQK